MKNAIGNTSNGNDIIPGTNWTYAAAASMAKEVSREDRLFGNRRNRRRRSAKRNDGLGLMVTDPARFTAETGWTPEDALEMALDIRREERIFGADFGSNNDGDADVETFADSNRADDFYVLNEDGSIDKEATRERRLFGSSRWN